jgi:3-hydroxybutyryl-CoA dehydrogenase
VTISNVGVIGAGLMGNGIAHVSAASGCTVVLAEVSLERAQAGLKVIENNMGRQVSKGTLAEADMQAALGRIKLTTDYADFATCDLVVEAATENEQLKKKIFDQLTPHLKADAIVASNTSSISITRLAAYTDRPTKFIGMHFFNPVPLMKLVELINGIATSPETTAAILAFGKQLGKVPIIAADSPSFIVNRILCPMINEAVFALGEGLGSVVDIDTGMKLGANHPMGPLMLADFVGLDTMLSVMRVMYEGFADSKYRPAPLLVKYVEAGWLGKKSGKGFYDYTGDVPVPTR